MLRLNQAIFVAAISILALVGCSKPNQSTSTTTQSSPAETPAAPVAASEQPATETPEATPKQGTESQVGFEDLHAVVSKTKAAVEAGNFAKAKAEFGKFEDFWSKVEDGVKRKSPNTYKAIEEGTDAVNKPLKESKPNKQKILAALKSLDKNIANAAKP